VMLEADGSALARAIGAAARGDALFTDDVLHGLYGQPGDGPSVQALTLTPREHEVHDLISQGLPDKQIAERLHISVKTVEKHVGSALRKTGTRNRTELAGISGRIGR
jgi:DNA-binding NarL/FixJ family response regulator